MLKLFLFIWLFFCLCPLGCQAQKNVILSREGKATDPYTWDFGQVKQGEVLEHEFSFKNQTSKILNIKSVNTSCGCTVSQVKKNTLQPGESTSLGVKFNTTGYSGLTQQFVYVNTDNLDNPIIRFIIKAQVEAKAKSKP
jgi:hypothetical protein